MVIIILKLENPFLNNQEQQRPLSNIQQTNQRGQESSPPNYNPINKFADSNVQGQVLNSNDKRLAYKNNHVNVIFYN